MTIPPAKPDTRQAMVATGHDKTSTVSQPGSLTPPEQMGNQGTYGVDRVKAMQDSKPKRADFTSEEEFEEAYGYWMSHTGRILAMLAPSRGSRPK